MEAIIIFIAQILFQFTRTLSTRFTSRDHVVQTVIWSTIVSVFWLITTAMGVKAVFDKDWLVIGVYLVGGAIGTYYAMKIKLKP